MSQQRKRFRPELTVFHHSSKIHPALLNDVVHCYTKGRPVCKSCYYRRKLVSLIKYQDGYMYCRECRKHGERVWLMPASQMCYNFGNFKEVPIPKSAGRRQEDGRPFEMCQKDDHFNCFDRSANSEIWFAHTIEELVIWTIEREYRCSFKDYIERHYFSGRKVYWKYNNQKRDEEKEEEEEEEGGRGEDPVMREGWNKRGRANYTSLSKSLSDLDLDEFQDLNYTGGIYDPEKIEIKFKSISDIPPQLLKDIAKCYTQGQEVCKFCFFRKLEEVKKPSDSRGFSPACLRCRMHWQSIKIIPASSMCCNFNTMKNIPISIPVIKPSKTQVSHSYCSKSDHNKCFIEGYSQGFSHAHSVEELVIWLVERDSGVGYGNFGEYIKNNKLIDTSGWRSTTPTKGGANNKSRYDPDKYLFTSISDIPQDLLHSISKCYEQQFEICRICFFDSLSGSGYNNHPTLTKRDEGRKTCEKGHLWRPQKVIPSSPSCTSYGVYIAITPVPKHMMISKSPFKVCSMADHKACFEKTRENNPWFPHTIEEMVIWTVERETGKSFQYYYQDFLKPDNYKPLTGHAHTKTTPINYDDLETFDDYPDESSVANSNETTPMYFDNLSSSSSSNLVVGVANEAMNINEGPLGEGLTLDEASRFFPALVSQGGTPLINNNVKNTTDPLINEPLPPTLNNHLLTVNTATLPAYNQPTSTTLPVYNQPTSTTLSAYQPTSTTLPAYQPTSTTLPAYQPTSTTLPAYQPTSTTLPAYQPTSNTLPVSLSLYQSSVPLIHKDYQPLSQPLSHQYDHPLSLLQSQDEEEVSSYECYLCYREFDSPRDIAEHCMKERHLEIVKQDMAGTGLWIYYPPPPDQSPEEYKLCQKPTHMCSSRLRCCKAHSNQELQEWYVRHRHRQQCSLYNTTPTGLVSMATINKPHGDYNGIKVVTNPSHHTMVRSGTTVNWTLDITGQGWQTLIGVSCVSSNSIVTPLTIVSCKGDTIYSVFPRSSEWVIPSFKEGILLGTVTIVVRATPVISGFNEHHVRLFIGGTECLDISLKVLCQ